MASRLYVVAKIPKTLYDGRVRRIFLSLIIPFLLLLIGVPHFSFVNAQSPSCTITVSPETGYSNKTTFSASGTANVQLDQRQSRIDIDDQTRLTVLRSIGFSTLSEGSFSIDAFGPFLKEGKYHLSLIGRTSRGQIVLCHSSTIEIVLFPTPTPGGPTIAPTIPPTCNPPGRNPANHGACADLNCYPIGATRDAPIDARCEPFGVVAPTPTPTEIPSPLPQCSQWADLKGNHINIQQAVNRKDIKCIAVGTAIGNISTEPQGFVKRIFSLVLGIAGGIALILIILSGYKMMASQGNPEQINAARDQLLSAIIGLLFIIFSFVILQVIGVDILKIPGFKP